MSIEYERNTAKLSDIVGVEDAEGLLEWLQTHPKGKIDLFDCKHLHAANLQVLMAVRPEIVAWPKNTDLRTWLQGALNWR